MKYETIFLLLLLTTLSFLSAQDVASIKSSFSQQKYSEVILATDKLSNFTIDSQPEMALIRAQSFYKIGNYHRAIGVLRLFEDEFATSIYKVPAFYYLGICQVKNGDFKQALLSLAVVESANYNELSGHAKKMLSVISSLKLSESDYSWLKQQSPNEIINKYLLAASANIHILVVLPLSGKSAKEGKEILDGLKYALRTLHTDKSQSIFLDVVNSESNIALMQKRVIQKITTRRYNLIIGEFKSLPSAALAGLASLAQIPMISPTATDNYISEISDYIYQLNCSSYTMGEKIAEFAIDSLSQKTFAVLSPVTPEGKEAVAGFINQVNKKGGKILTQEWYYETGDISKQVQKIRESALESNRMSLHKYMSPDSIKKVPISGIDAIFMPANREDIKPLAPQVASVNLTSKLLGTYGWDSAKELNKVAGNVDSLVFVKENSLNYENQQYIDFVSQYRVDTGRAPTSLEIVGYDAMLFYLQILKKSNGKSINDVLKQVQEFSGILGKIKFQQGHRSNSAVELYRYTTKNGIKRVGK